MTVQYIVHSITDTVLLMKWWYDVSERMLMRWCAFDAVPMLMWWRLFIVVWWYGAVWRYCSGSMMTLREVITMPYSICLPVVVYYWCGGCLTVFDTWYMYDDIRYLLMLPAGIAQYCYRWWEEKWPARCDDIRADAATLLLKYLLIPGDISMEVMPWWLMYWWWWYVDTVPSLLLVMTCVINW